LLYANLIFKCIETEKFLFEVMGDGKMGDF